jgi:enediyne biosynthesis protein E4
VPPAHIHARALTAGLLVGGIAVGLATVRSQGQPAPLFTDVTASTGLDFQHQNGATGRLLLPEVTGSGGAVFDFDNDGDLDVFAVQSGPIPGALSTASAAAARRAGSRLYRNDLGGASRQLRFVDVTERSGIRATGYGMGAATGDIDNDGWIDLYLTNLGSNQMLRNNGDGTFADITMTSRTDDPRWSTSATFLDYDRDGWLDLFVANYVDFDAGMKRDCFSSGSARDYCNPVVYRPVPDRLFRNNHDGTFTDVSVKAGIGRATSGRGLGVLAADFNDDGWLDLYVANDGDGNQLWINERGTGVFRDEALLAGVAFNRTGQAQGSMGIDVGDIDRDGDEDLFVTNLDNESNTLYLNTGKGLFEDRTSERGLFRLGSTGFGTRFLDYDNDGWLDLVVVNGAVRHLPGQVRRGESYPLKQRNQLARNDAGRRFVDITNTAGPAFDRLDVARGVAAGDLDNDGDSDLLIFNNSGPTRVLVNESGHRHHWIGVRAIERRRDSLQARIEIVRRGSSLVRRVQTDGSYVSASDPRVIVGLGTDNSPQTARVRWVSGQVEEFRDLAPDRYWVLESGKPPRQP